MRTGSSQAPQDTTAAAAYSEVDIDVQLLYSRRMRKTLKTGKPKPKLILATGRPAEPPAGWRCLPALFWAGLVLGLFGCVSDQPDFDAIILAEDNRQVDAPILSQAVASPNDQMRARAAVAYGRIAQAPGIAPLLNLLNDSEATVRSAAAFALGQFGWFDSRVGHEAEITSGLTPLLSDLDAGVRSHAVAAIGKMADPATATMMVTPLLHDADVGVRAEAATALFRCRQLSQYRDATATPPQLTDDALSALQALGNDSDATARRAAIYYFSRILDTRGLSMAKQLAQDGDVWVRLYAVLALKRIADASATSVLLAAATDSEYTVRLAAVQAFDALMLADKIPQQLLHDPVFHVRAAVVTAYGDSSTVDDGMILNLWNTDTSPTVRAAALTAWAQRRQAGAAPLLMEGLADPNEEIRAAAAGSASALGPGAVAAAFMQKGLTDSMEIVRVAVLGLLGSVPDPWAYSAIELALSAPGLAERGTAAGVLSSRTESDRVAVAWQAYMNSSGHRWRDIRQSLLDVFDSEMSADSTDHLRTAASDPELEVANYARQLLAARGITDLPPLPPENFVYSPFRDQRYKTNPVVAIETSHGTFQIECFAADAPVHVASFVGLVQQGIYRGLPWHRVVSDFVVQGGDPEGSGWGDAGFSLRLEINEQRFDRGALGMPRGADFDSGGSQLFFNHIPTPHLDGQYTVFGQVTSGIDVIDQIEQGDRIHNAYVVE